jgi:hypothetical protein
MIFKSPEDPIHSYFEGLAENDMQKVRQTFAIDEMSESFNFALYTERVGVLMPSGSLAPSEYPLYVEANRMQLSAEMTNRMKFFAYSLLSIEEVGDSVPIKIDPERTKSFMEAVDPAKLSALELQRIELANKKVMSTTNYLENAAVIARMFGADESTERVALFVFEAKYYYVGFTLLRYADTWKISRQASAIAGTNPLGVALETTPEEFETLSNGN